MPHPRVCMLPQKILHAAVSKIPHAATATRRSKINIKKKTKHFSPLVFPSFKQSGFLFSFPEERIPWGKVEKSETPFGFGVYILSLFWEPWRSWGVEKGFRGTHGSKNKSLLFDSLRKEAQRQKDRQGRGSLSLTLVEFQREGSETSQKMCGVWEQSGQEPGTVGQALQRGPDSGDTLVGSWPSSALPGSTGMLQQYSLVDRMNTVLTNSPGRLSSPASGQLMRDPRSGMRAQIPHT